MAASDASRIRLKQNGLRRHLSLLVLTLAFTSVFSSTRVCASSDEGLEHVPTLKEIYGAVPRNSFPIVRREVRIPQPNRDSSSQRAKSGFSESHRRGLRSKPDALTVPTTDINIDQNEFYAQLQIGTPPQSLLMIIDTGSQPFWAQSKQCIECFTELLPRYDPTVSSTFEPEIVNGSYVPWTYLYADGGANVGYVATETLTIGSGGGNQIVIPEFEFAVSVNNTGSNNEYSGIMGLIPSPPGAPSPFLAQLETLSNGRLRKFSKKFRYCFPDKATEYSTTSFLSFGEIDESQTDSLFSSTKHLHKSKTLWTPIVPNPVNSFYALNMTAITVAGNRISIDPQELTLESVQLNDIMTIIDSGTTLTYLREPYFSMFLEAYLYEIRTLATSETILFVDDGLYFNITRDVFDGYLFPTVSFIFQKWQSKHAHGERQEEIEVFLPKDNVFQLGSGLDILYKFSIQNTTGKSNTIGNIAQQNFLIEYDLEKSRVGFLRATCTFDY